MSKKVELQDTEFLTGKSILSYAFVWEPRETTSGEMKYSCAFIFPKSDKKTVARLQKAVEAAYEKGAATLKGNGSKTPKLSEVNHPLRDGDEKFEETGEEEYKNCYYISAKSNRQPEILHMDGSEILDQREIYSGAIGAGHLNCFAYNHKGNKGIGCWLKGLVKIKDAKRLGGGTATSEAIAYLEIDELDNDSEDDEIF